MTNRLDGSRLPNSSVSGHRTTALSIRTCFKAGVYEQSDSTSANFRRSSSGLALYSAGQTRQEKARIRTGFWKSLKPTPGELDLKVKRLKNSDPERRTPDTGTDLNSNCNNRKNVICFPSERTDPEGKIADHRNHSVWPVKRKGFAPEKRHYTKDFQHKSRIPYDVSRTTVYVVLRDSSSSNSATKSVESRRSASTTSELTVDMDRVIQKGKKHTNRTRSANTAPEGSPSRVIGSRHRLAIRRLMTALSRSRSQDSDSPYLERPQPANVIQPASRSLTLYNMSLYPELHKTGICRSPVSGTLSHGDDWRSQLSLITWLRLLNADMEEYLQREHHGGNTSSPDRPISWPQNKPILMSSSGAVTLNGSKSYIKASSIPLEPKRTHTGTQPANHRRDTLPLPVIGDRYKRRSYNVNLAPTGN
ncbi:hypothetical protein LSH36_101g03033 [Paralvinella palmiformis]|uniref:Uncharacterized protein n=1 Tax=Paralvinella palmiformis TaxID=53620 RepID=A0AAD9N9W2_9ANNE|nr:hypothetical protein LSH36_101g03033 [Paralvinella palmiformis]